MSSQGKPVPFHVEVQPNRQNGLTQVTYVKCEQIVTIAKARLLGRKAVGTLSLADMRKVETAVELSLALP